MTSPVTSAIGAYVNAAKSRPGLEAPAQPAGKVKEVMDRVAV